MTSTLRVLLNNLSNQGVSAIHLDSGIEAMMHWKDMQHTEVFMWKGSEIDICNAINSYSASRNNWCTVGGDGGCRVGEVRAGTTSPMPDHKGLSYSI